MSKNVDVVLYPLDLKKTHLLEIKEPRIFKNELSKLSFDEMKQLKYDFGFRNTLCREFDREIEFAYDIKKATRDRTRQDKQNEDLLNAATWKGATAGGFAGFSVSGVLSLWYALSLVKGLLTTSVGGVSGSLIGGFWARKETNKTLTNDLKQSITPSSSHSSI